MGAQVADIVPDSVPMHRLVLRHQTLDSKRDSGDPHRKIEDDKADLRMMAAHRRNIPCLCEAQGQMGGKPLGRGEKEPDRGGGRHRDIVERRFVASNDSRYALHGGGPQASLDGIALSRNACGTRRYNNSATNREARSDHGARAHKIAMLGNPWNLVRRQNSPPWSCARAARGQVHHETTPELG